MQLTRAMIEAIEIVLLSILCVCGNLVLHLCLFVTVFAFAIRFILFYFVVVVVLCFNVLCACCLFFRKEFSLD